MLDFTFNGFQFNEATFAYWLNVPANRIRLCSLLVRLKTVAVLSVLASVSTALQVASAEAEMAAAPEISVALTVSRKTKVMMTAEDCCDGC